MGSRYGDTDPIMALATAAGAGALSVFRLSGQGTLSLLEKAFSRVCALREADGNTVLHGWILQGGDKVDEVLLSVFRSPRSYTGEESAEVSCHGGRATERAVRRSLLDAGFRDALPGEFTFRAFLNGKLDLTRAESVMEIVGARSERERGGALGRLSGSLEREIAALRDTLLETLVSWELLLDYSELDGVENEEPIPGKASLAAALGRLKTLLSLYAGEKRLREGPLVVIVGPPNAGKSSLFNLLLREERAIVTDEPGTTRDWLEERIELNGISLRLVDTAGLREADNPVERAGVERSRSLLEKADLVLYLGNGGSGKWKMGNGKWGVAQKSQPTLLLWNKCDIAPPPAGFAGLAVSAKSGEGLPLLIERISEILFRAAFSAENGDPMMVEASTAPGNERQRSLIEKAASSLEEALLPDAPLDGAASFLRQALNYLGEITGEVTTTDILDSMFSRFCVGK